MSTPSSPWARSYNDVKMHIPGLTDAVHKQMLYHIMNDFLDRTNAWIEEIPIAITPPTKSYAFAPAHKGEINRLLVLYDPAQPNPPKKWAGAATMYKPGVIELVQAPANAATWNAVVSKTLDTLDDSGYPEIEAADQWLISKYGDAFMYGVLSRLMAMPAKPYSNTKLAQQHWQTYVAERSKARTDQLKMNVFGAQNWAFPQEFATVSRKGWA